MQLYHIQVDHIFTERPNEREREREKIYILKYNIMPGWYSLINFYRKSSADSDINTYQIT